MSESPKQISRRCVLTAAGAAAASAAIAGITVPYIITKHPGRNIIWMTADTFRGDRIGFPAQIDGTPGSLTPTLDTLTEKGFYCPNGISPSSFTPISVLSMMYDEDPTRCGGKYRELGISTKKESLPNKLRGKNYQTLMVSANEWTDLEAIERGFDTKHTFRKHIDFKGPGTRYEPWASTNVNARALDMLAGRKRTAPFFLYLHYMDNHEPYYCPGSMLPRLGSRWHNVNAESLHRALLSGEKDYRTSFETTPWKTALENLKENYNASIFHLDTQIGNLLTTLEENGELEDTLVIFTADHGEQFADNTETSLGVGHARSLSQPEIHVPVVAWHKEEGKVTNTAIPLQSSNANLIHQIIEEFVETGRVTATTCYQGSRRGIISALRWRENYDGFSFVRGPTKITGEFGEDREIENLQTFELGKNNSASKKEPSQVSSETLDLMMTRLSGIQGAAIDPENMSEEMKRKMKALGYLN